MAKLIYLELSGNPREVGLALGQFGAHTLHTHVLPSVMWHDLMRWKSSAFLERSLDAIAHTYPYIWNELHGLATGLELPVEDVFLWNAYAHYASDALCSKAGSGCFFSQNKQVQFEFPLFSTPIDNMPWALAKCLPAQGSAYVALVQPGLLAGSALCMSQYGVMFASYPKLRASVDEHNHALIPDFVRLRALLELKNTQQLKKMLASPDVLNATQVQLLLRGGVALEAQSGLLKQLSVTSAPMSEAIPYDWDQPVGDGPAYIRAHANPASIDWRVYTSGSATEPEFQFRDLVSTVSS